MHYKYLLLMDFFVLAYDSFSLIHAFAFPFDLDAALYYDLVFKLTFII